MAVMCRWRLPFAGFIVASVLWLSSGSVAMQKSSESGQEGSCSAAQCADFPGSGPAAAEKKASLLVTILTSNNLLLLRIVLATVVDQVPHNLDVRVLLVVNSKKEGYYEQVVKELGGNFDVVKTESNGRPGMGHNSCLRIFRERASEDYLYILDGDDFLYRTAFHTIEKVIENFPFDVVLLVPADKLVAVSTEQSQVHAREGGRMSIRDSFTYKMEIDTEDVYSTPNSLHTVSVFMYDLFAVGGFKPREYGVRLRTAFWSRKAVESISLPLYDESMYIHDDVAPQFWAMSLVNTSSDLEVKTVWTSHIFLYNAVNPFSVTTQIGEDIFTQENAVLFSRYQERYAYLWKGANGGFHVYPSIVNDSDIKSSSLRYHKEEFLAKYSPFFQEYFLLGGYAGVRRG